MNLHRFAAALKTSVIQPQAYLFYGPAGASKEFRSLEFFKALNCAHAADSGMACGKCPSCRSISGFVSPDLYCLFSSFDWKSFEKMTRFLVMKPYSKPVESLVKRESLKLYTFLQYQPQMKKEDLARLEALYHEPFTPSVAEKLLAYAEMAKKIGTGIPVEALRKTMEKLSVSPYELSKKLLLIKDIAHLSTESANALLKTFEEPHDDLMIFLITSTPRAILPTIRSRAMKMALSPLSESEKQELTLTLDGLDLNPPEMPLEKILSRAPEEWDSEETERVILFLRSRLQFFSPIDRERDRFLKQMASGLLEYNLPLSYLQRSLEVLLKYQKGV